MNGLTLAIYFSGIVNNFQEILSAIAVISGFLALVLLVIYAVSEGEVNHLNHLKWLVPVAISVGLVAAIIPDRETVLLMAGSEIGETVVTSPEGRELLNDIKEVIHKQLEDLKK